MISARPLELKIQKKKNRKKIIGVILALHIWRSRIEKSLKITSVFKDYWLKNITNNSHSCLYPTTRSFWRNEKAIRKLLKTLFLMKLIFIGSIISCVQCIRYINYIHTLQLWVERDQISRESLKTELLIYKCGVKWCCTEKGHTADIRLCK